jgi:hypothetical protein
MIKNFGLASLALVIGCIPGRLFAGAITQALDGSVAQNNALLVAGFALVDMGLPVHIRQMAKALGAGRALDRPVAAAKLEAYLIKSGLSVSRMALAGTKAIASDLGRADVPKLLIISLRLRKAGVVGQVGRHYLVVAAVGKKGAFLADVGTWEGWMSFKEIRGRLAKYLHRTALLVTEPVYPITRHRPISVAHQVRSVGRYIVVPVNLRNDLLAPAAIATQWGSCDCFRYASLEPSQLNPGATGRLLMYFYTRKVPFGVSYREVTVGFRGFHAGKLHLLVKIFFPRAAVPLSPTWFPHRLDFGVAAETSKIGYLPVRVALPPGVKIRAVRASIPAIRIVRLASEGRQHRDRSGRKIYRFAADLDRLGTGWISAQLTVVTRPRKYTITIPISGRVLGKKNVGGQPPANIRPYVPDRPAPADAGSSRAK